MIPRYMHPSTFVEAEMYPHKIPVSVNNLSSNIWTKYTNSNGDMFKFLGSLEDQEKCAVIDKFNDLDPDARAAKWAGAHQ